MKLHQSLYARSRWAMAFAALMASSEVHAYVGPGAGLSAIGSVLAFIGGTFMLILGFAWYPFKRLYRRLKGKSSPREKLPADSDVPMPERKSDEST